MIQIKKFFAKMLKGFSADGKTEAFITCAIVTALLWLMVEGFFRLHDITPFWIKLIVAAAFHYLIYREYFKEKKAEEQEKQKEENKKNNNI